MASNDPLDRQKSGKSRKSTTSTEGALKRWKSFVKPFAAQDACDHCGRGSCDNGFEGHWDNGVPSVRPRTGSKLDQEGWPRALSAGTSKPARSTRTRYPSSQAMSGADGFRLTYDTADGGYEDDDYFSARPGVGRGTDTQSFETAPNQPLEHDDTDDDEMGLAQNRRSKRYSAQKSPLSPTFNFAFRDRKATNDRVSRSTFKRDSIRLSALPPMPQNRSSQRSFPAGQGLAPLKSASQPRSLRPGESFIFPRPPPSPYTVRSPKIAPRTVTWNGLLDPERPQNRPVPIKLISTFLLLGLTLAVTFVSAVMTPASFPISRGFHVSQEIIILASTLTVLGFAIGAPFFGASSEKHGRKKPLLLGVAVFAIFNVPIGLTRNLPTLLAFRFFAGVFGAAPLAIVPATLADIWSPVGRGFALSFFAALTVIGPVGGAICGSYLAFVDYPGWRWTVWIGAFLAAFFGLPLAFVYKESSESVLLHRKASLLRRVTKDLMFHAEGEDDVSSLRVNMIKSLVMMIEPSLLLPTIHMAFTCGVINLLFVSYGFAFHTERHWQRGAQDLPLAPIFGGCLIGIFINFIVSKSKHTAVIRREGQAAPETRIIPWIIGSWILPAGLLVFAWTSSPKLTFIPQLMAGVPTGIGASLILIGGFNWIVDTYVTMPSLAVGSNTLLRLAIAFSFPLFAPRLYGALGINWAGTALAIVAVLMIPIPILMMKLGPKFRGMGKFAVKGNGPTTSSRRDWSAEMAQTDEALPVAVQGAPPSKV